MATIIHDGMVLDQATGEPVAGLRVEAWDADGILPSLVGYAVTGTDGAFHLELTEQDVDALFGERTAAASFKVVLESGPYLVADLRGSQRWELRDPQSSSVLFADLGARTPADPAVFVVRGVLLDADAGPLGAMTVEAYDMALRSETLLGTASTDPARSTFHITYLPAQLSATLANLQLRARPAGGGDPLATSETRCQAPPTVVVELVSGARATSGRPSTRRSPRPSRRCSARWAWRI